jgi:sodium/hydrogen antiporter
VALAGTRLKRLPLTTSILYLGAGLLLGRLGLGLIDLEIPEHGVFWEYLTEIAVLISLFTAGLKLRIPWPDERWWLSLRLAFGSMAITVGLIAAAGFYLLGLPLGGAILLGAILAPTDPVLASDVQVAHPGDRDRVRFGLTGEAGLNDGAAFPFVMLGLGLLGMHDLGPFGLRWVAVDLLWAVAGGLLVGCLTGSLIGRLVLHIRRERKEALGLDDFLGLGLIALSYGAALALHTYGFLAVFAAGVTLRYIERTRGKGLRPDPDVKLAALAGESEAIATHPGTAPAYMAQAVLGFNEQVERLGEMVVMLILGSVLRFSQFNRESLLFLPLLFLAIRPVAVYLATWGTPTLPSQKRLISWFGIRGIGSLYYLSYALGKGLPEGLSNRLVELTLATVTVSVLIHGISVTPLMDRYAARKLTRKQGPRPA